MHGIKPFGLLLGDFQHPHADDAETVFLESVDDVAGGAFGHSVWLDDGKCALQMSFMFGR